MAKDPIRRDFTADAFSDQLRKEQEETGIAMGPAAVRLGRRIIPTIKQSFYISLGKPDSSFNSNLSSLDFFVPHESGANQIVSIHHHFPGSGSSRRTVNVGSMFSTAPSERELGSENYRWNFLDLPYDPDSQDYEGPEHLHALINEHRNLLEEHLRANPQAVGAGQKKFNTRMMNERIQRGEMHNISGNWFNLHDDDDTFTEIEGHFDPSRNYAFHVLGRSTGRLG